MNIYKETTKTLMLKSLSDLNIYNAGFEECKPSHEYGPTFREHHIIHFVTKGKGTLLIDNHEYILRQNDAFIIPANKIAKYQADEFDPWSYSWIGFLGINADKYAYQIINSSVNAYILCSLDVIKYHYCIQEITRLSSYKNSSYLKANSTLYLLMANLFDDLKIEDNHTTKSSLADEIKLYIDINYPENIRISDIADYYKIHPNYLSRIFSEKFEIFPKQYLLNLKLTKACELLISTNYTISVIANSIGFEDQLLFSKQFKKKYTISPTDYRKYKVDI